MEKGSQSILHVNIQLHANKIVIAFRLTYSHRLLHLCELLLIHDGKLWCSYDYTAWGVSKCDKQKLLIVSKEKA